MNGRYCYWYRSIDYNYIVMFIYRDAQSILRMAGYIGGRDMQLPLPDPVWVYFMYACRQFRPSPETSLHDLNLTVGSSQLYVQYNFTFFLYQNRYQLKRYCNTSRLPKYIERPPRQQWVFISMAFEKGNIVIVHIFTCTFLLNVILAGCCTPSVI